MTTLQDLDHAENSIEQRMIRLQALARQYDEMKAASKDYKALQAQLEEARTARQNILAAQEEQRITNITQMYVNAHSSVRDTSAIAGYVRVEIMTKHGDPYTTDLRHLVAHERQALIRNYWEQVPVSIRALGDTPEAALHEYVAAKARGYIRG